MNEPAGDPLGLLVLVVVLALGWLVWRVGRSGVR